MPDEIVDNLEFVASNLRACAEDVKDAVLAKHRAELIMERLKRAGVNVFAAIQLLRAAPTDPYRPELAEKN